MKTKNIFYLLAILLSFSACKKDRITSFEIEKSFPDPNVRFEDFKQAIASGTNGFQMNIQVPDGGLYGGYIKFDGAGNLKFVGDNNIANATSPKESKYSLKVIQTNSVLSFDKTSDFGIFAIGLSADTSYSYKMTIGDTIKLVGNAKGTKMNLVKVQKNIADEYLAGKMAIPMTELAKISAFKKYFKRLTIGSKAYDIQLSTSTKKINVLYANGVDIKLHITRYYFSSNGLVFETPFVDGTSKFTGLDNLLINAATSSGTFSVGESTGSLTNEIKPVLIDKVSANDFLSTIDKQWVSQTGFTKDAIIDYLNVRALSGFSRIIHWVGYETDYDLIGFTFGNSIRYGPAVVPNIGVNGVMVFQLEGVLGTLPTATADKNKVVTTINNFVDPNGFYVVQSGVSGGTYDLVAVNGGNLWINYR
jgi:hypothetical protein